METEVINCQFFSFSIFILLSFSGDATQLFFFLIVFMVDVLCV